MQMYKQIMLKMYFPVIFLAIFFACKSKPTGTVAENSPDTEVVITENVPRGTAIAYENGGFKLKDGTQVEVPFYGKSEAVHFWIVRHAEKETIGDDPVLTPAGKARAQRLGAVLKGLRVDAICTTNLKRTIETGEVLYHHLKAPPFQTFAPSSMSSWLTDALAEGKGKTFVHVGHSNTIPEMLLQLGLKPIVKIGDTEYDHLFVVGVMDGKSEMLHLQFE
jgi:2,3-bisphosphoglycerate-dependent phosphoglycerate mutase